MKQRNKYNTKEPKMEKISAVYKIINTVTGDSYVGSSKDVMRRWREHKSLSVWKKYPKSPLYNDIQKYGVGKFRFQILAPVMEECLKQVEQEFIEMLKPTYNNMRANGQDVERYKEVYMEYKQSDKGKEVHKKANRKYYSQYCFYKGETLTLKALSHRFKKAGIVHSDIEAKKYLLDENTNKGETK